MKITDEFTVEQAWRVAPLLPGIIVVVVIVHPLAR